MISSRNKEMIQLLIYSDYKDKDMYFKEIINIVEKTCHRTQEGPHGLDKDKALTAIRELASAGLQASK